MASKARSERIDKDQLSGHELFSVLPSRPSDDLDRVIDATERCLARYGIRRISMTDIAKEMGVARTTLYRQISSLSEATMLVVARELYRYLDDFVELFGDGSNPDALIDAAVLAIDRTRQHPLGVRLLTDEGDVLGDAITSGLLPAYATHLSRLLTPFFDTAVAAGGIEVSDTALAAEWLVRTVAVLVLVPATGDLESMVRFALEPVLGNGVAVPAATSGPRK